MKKQAFNPYLPNFEYVPDGEPYVFGNRLYVYGSHDRFNGETYCVNDYVCWSAPVDDLGAWRFEGVIYRKEQDPQCKEDSYMYAPDIAIGKDGRYYLYYTLDMSATMAVAVGDSPIGPFTYYGRVQDKSGHILGSAPEDVLQFDPGILVDDDGKVWLYTGYGTQAKGEKFTQRFGVHAMDGCYCIPLADDMITALAEPKLVLAKRWLADGTPFEDHPFFEASSIRKIGKLYYLVYSSCVYHELCYAVSEYPDRDFRYGGVIVSNGDVGLEDWTPEKRANYTGNNHGGMVQIGDQWYIFYHRHTNYHDFSRQGCAEKITILPDGSIPQVEMTSCGLNDGDLVGKGTYPASIACQLYAQGGACGVQSSSLPEPHKHPRFTQLTPDHEGYEDQYIANLRQGSVAGYKYFDLQATATIALMLRGSAGTVHIFDRMGGNPLSKITFPESRDWHTAEAPLLGGNAHSCLFFQVETDGAVDLFQFTLK